MVFKSFEHPQVEAGGEYMGSSTGNKSQAWSVRVVVKAHWVCAPVVALPARLLLAKCRCIKSSPGVS